jgi:hypothetical protein
MTWRVGYASVRVFAVLNNNGFKMKYTVVLRAGDVLAWLRSRARRALIRDRLRIRKLRSAPENDAARLAAVHAAAGVTGAETTWVATGPGYDLARTKPISHRSSQPWIGGEPVPARVWRRPSTLGVGLFTLQARVRRPVPAASPTAPGPVVRHRDERPGDGEKG